jgi:hypothetical protein
MLGDTLLLLLHAEDFILAALAHTRDAILVLREGITEVGGLTLTGHAQPLFDDLVAVLTAQKIREESVDCFVFLVCFHVVHYTQSWRKCKDKKEKLVVVSPYGATGYVRRAGAPQKIASTK